MSKEKRSFAIIGCGRFGMNLALSLSEMGYEVLVVDNSQDKINEIAEYVTYAVRADVSQEDALKELGIGNIDCVIVSLSSNFEASVMATSICKELGVDKIVAKAKNDHHGKILKQVGATKIVIPEKDMGIRLAHFLGKPSMYEYIELSGDYSIAEMEVPESWIGKTVEKLNIRAVYNVSVVGILNDDYHNINPAAKDSFRAGDKLLILGTTENLDNIEKLS